MEKSLLLTKAKNAAIAHDFTTASRMYKELLRDDESNVEYLKQLGSIYVQAGEDEKAIPYYQQIITFYPHFVDAMNSLGAIYRRLKRYEESIEILQRALDEDRQLPAVNYNLGFTYKEMGNYKDAIDAFEKVIHTNPDDVLAYNHLGSIYYAQKDYQKSITSYKRGLQIDHNHPILNYNLARCYEASKNTADAVRCYKLALKTKPGWTDAIKDFTSLLMNIDDNKGAAEIIRQGIQLYPNNAEMLSILGDIYLNDYDYAEAEKTFKKATSIDPTNIKSLIGLSKALEKSDKSEYALDAILAAMELNPENPDAKKQYAQTLLSERDYEGAKITIDELTNPQGERDLQVLDLNGQYYICVNEEEKAKTYFDQIKRLNHHYKDYMINAANRFAQAGNYEKAEIYANEYIVHRPENIDGYNTLGKIAYLKEDYDKAQEYYKKATQLGKNNALAEKQIKTISDKVQRDKLFAEKVEEIEIENGIIAPNEAENQVEKIDEADDSTDDFDFAVMGQTVPLQEGLTQKEEDYWKQLDEDKEDSDVSVEDFAKQDDETEAESLVEPETPVVMQMPEIPDEQPEESPVEMPQALSDEPETEKDTNDELMNQLKNQDEDDDFDIFGDSAIDEPETEIPVEKSALDDEIEDSPFDFDDYKTSQAEEIPAPEPKKVPVENEKSEAVKKYEDFATKAAEKAMENAFNTQKMAEQMMEQQAALQQQTENALQNAMEKIQKLQQEQFRKQDQALEELMDNVPVDEVPEEIVEEPEITEETADETPVDSMDALLAQDEDSTDVELDVDEFVDEQEEFEFATVENLFEDGLFDDVSEKNECESESEINQKSETEKNAFSPEEMLIKIERILNDDDAALNNSEKIEMFKKLRLLCNYLPESERGSFQSCRNRMIIDYIISKLSGKPGLLLTAQSLIKSGVLGPEYNAQLDRNSEDELNNEMIRKVIKNMKSLTASLEDKDLSFALQASADNILERIELKNQKSAIF